MSTTVSAGTHLTLELWHPNCWALDATERASGGLLAHAIYNTPQATTDSVNGLFTAYGDSAAEVETLLDTIRESELTGALQELEARFDTARPAAPAPVAREFFVEYDPSDMICSALLEQGFVHNAPVQIEAGTEHWPVYFAEARRDIEGRLQAIRTAQQAEVSVASIRTPGDHSRADRRAALTPSQRDAFELARERGYYQWPRQVTTRELADELGVSKTTLLEHLRKAEATLLNPGGDQ